MSEQSRNAMNINQGHKMNAGRELSTEPDEKFICKLYVLDTPFDDLTRKFTVD